jgi:hypothetical protein
VIHEAETIGSRVAGSVKSTTAPAEAAEGKLIRTRFLIFVRN